MTDALAKKLSEATPARSGHKLRIEELFGDRPDVLEAIIAARKRGLSSRVIADVLSAEGEKVADGAVTNWLRSQGHV